jgi:hypothetical protein
MGERYYVTGVQLGMIKVALEKPGVVLDIDKLIEKITDEQFIGNFELDEDKKRFENQVKKIR